MSEPTRKTNESAAGLASRVASLDWLQTGKDLDAYGCAVAEGVLLRDQCRALSALYDQDALFRNRIVMTRHAFRRGEDKYCAYPLPQTLSLLPKTRYPPWPGVGH